MFFTLIFGDNVFIVLLANCVRDNSSCREKLAPTSTNGFNTYDAAVYSVHRCTL